jgi:hypothetical protein
VKSRPLIAAILAFWLAFGPVATAWAQSADKPCESTGMSMPADDCCGSGMDQANCLSACMAVAPAIAAPASPALSSIAASAVLATLSFRHASILAPPDIAPPKSSVS